MELYQNTAAELSSLIHAGEVRASEVCRAVLARTHEVDSKVGAYVTLMEDETLRQAQRVDAKRARGEELPPLAGVPVAVKDNICTKGALTTCASKMLYNFKPPYDATVVQKLAAQDVVVTGKVNMDEFAMGSSCENSAVHPTHNPHDLNRVPGGSSGGSAAVVASAQAPLFAGVRIPAAPSASRPPSAAWWGSSPPTARCRGLAWWRLPLPWIRSAPWAGRWRTSPWLADAIYGFDPLDSTSWDKPDFGRFAANLRPELKGKRIGLPKEYFGEGISAPVCGRA